MTYVVCFITTGAVDDVMMRIAFGSRLAVSNKFTTKTVLLSNCSTLTVYDRSLIAVIIGLDLGFKFD